MLAQRAVTPLFVVGSNPIKLCPSLAGFDINRRRWDVCVHSIWRNCFLPLAPLIAYLGDCHRTGEDLQRQRAVRDLFCLHTLGASCKGRMQNESVPLSNVCVSATHTYPQAHLNACVSSCVCSSSIQDPGLTTVVCGI